MKITTTHPASSYGVPVFLDDAGEVIASEKGIKLFRKTTGISVETLAKICGVAIGSVYNWQSGQLSVPVAALNVMRDVLGNGVFTKKNKTRAQKSV
jgi:DNA-binding transcriptional regulator YiaG